MTENIPTTEPTCVEQYNELLNWIVSQCDYHLRYTMILTEFDRFALNYTGTSAKFLIHTFRRVTRSNDGIIPSHYLFTDVMSELSDIALKVTKSDPHAKLPLSTLSDVEPLLLEAIYEAYHPSGKREKGLSLFEQTMVRLSNALYLMTGKKA